MFKVEKNNEKMGRYLADLIDQNYPSKRKFCKAYILATGEEPTEDTTRNMANRLSQIIKGTKAIQTYDLPYFTELLGVSCEQILSAGETCVPISKRITNYSIACSKDPAEWEAYINREDKLILNSDEYCKTVIDYALEFGNYEFLKYLMDKKYIWFDARDYTQYSFTFGAGTSIQRRDCSNIDYGLRAKLHTEDELRLNLITLAADHNDLQMLEELRARENPQLYYRTHYLSNSYPDFNSCYNERMLKHIASSSEIVLDYFTDSFEIIDRVNYKDGSKRRHTFMFPFISKLLDLLIIQKSNFAETAIKKALKYNKATYQKLCKLITTVKNGYNSAEIAYFKDMWINACQENLNFHEDCDMIRFSACYTTVTMDKYIDGIITNVARITKIPSTPILKHLAIELNDSYDAIRNIKDHLEEVVK